MNCCIKTGFLFFGIVAFILSLTGLACFSLEVAKIAIFNQTDGMLKLHPMDYVYLVLLLLGLSGFWCYASSNGNSCVISGSLISLVIMILYTVFTKNEMGDIPFFCPSDYPYPSQLIYTACKVRAANLLLMWISPAVTLFVILVIFVITTIFAFYTTDTDITNSIV